MPFPIKLVLHQSSNAMNIIRASILLLSLGLVSCATSVSSPQDAVRLAAKVSGNSNPEVYWVPSSGFTGDATFVAMSKVAPSHMAYDLADFLRKSGDSERTVIVTGEGSRKAGQVCADALGLQTSPLPRLTVFFIGSAEDSIKASQAAAKVRCRFHHLLPE